MLYYIHGYQSSPDSNKGTIFKEKLNAKTIKYRDCKSEDLVISDCLKRIFEVIKNDKDVVLIGSSFGGFLAAKTALENPNVKKLVLLNPAIIPPYYDLKTIKDMPQRIIKDMIDKRLFENKLNTEITILKGTEDKLIPNKWILEFAMAQEATIMFLHDDHRFSYNSAMIPNILSSKGIL